MKSSTTIRPPPKYVYSENALARRSAAVVVDRIHAVHGIGRAAARAVGPVHEPRIGIADRCFAEPLGVLATGSRGVVVVPHVERAAVLGSFVLLVLLGRLAHVVELEDHFIDGVAAADRGVVVTGDLSRRPRIS